MTEWVTLYPQTSEPLREEVDLYVASPLWMELRAYLEKELHMTIVNSQRVMTVEKITQIDEKYLEMDVNDYNCVAVVSSHTYNSDGVMFEFTQSRHRPDRFVFYDLAHRTK